MKQQSLQMIQAKRPHWISILATCATSMIAGLPWMKLPHDPGLLLGKPMTTEQMKHTVGGVSRKCNGQCYCDDGNCVFSGGLYYENAPWTFSCCQTWVDSTCTTKTEFCLREQFYDDFCEFPTGSSTYDTSKLTCS